MTFNVGDKGSRGVYVRWLRQGEMRHCGPRCGGLRPPREALRRPTKRPGRLSWGTSGLRATMSPTSSMCPRPQAGARGGCTGLG